MKFLLFAAIVIAQPRVWLTCPPSFEMSQTRPGYDQGPCEPFDAQNSFVQEVTAGSRLKVGWVSGNRGGGYAKLSLAPFSDNLKDSDFSSSVLKVTCFGYDQRENRFSFGSCNHPCNARGGCGYPQTVDDNERYDTTITIPYNINGNYVLQLVAYVGVSLSPVYSCSLLKVIDGDTKRTCTAPSSIPVATGCRNVGSYTPELVTQNNNAGAFCFSTTDSGKIDGAITSRPVNYQCDPRSSCSLSNLSNLCEQDINETILEPFASPHVATCTSTSTAVEPTATIVPAYSSCDLESSKCEDGYVCCIGPLDITSQKSTCRPQTDCSSFSSTTTTTTTTTTQMETSSYAKPASTIVPAYSCCKLGTSICEEGFVCCVGQLDLTSQKYTCRPQSDCAQVSMVQATATTTTTTTTTSSAPSACQTYPIMPDKTECDINNSPFRCSGVKLAQCAYVATSTGVFSYYVFQNCAPGSTCVENSGSAYCGFEESCSAPIETVPAYSECILDQSTCENGYVCCIGNEDAQSSKFTCRPQSDCFSASSGIAEATTDPSTTVPATEAFTTTTETTAATVVPTPTGATDFTTPIATTEPLTTITTAAIETATASGIPITSEETSTTNMAIPTSECVTLNEFIEEGTLCEPGVSPIRCSGTNIATCIHVKTENGFEGQYQLAACAGSKVCSNLPGYPVCDWPSEKFCTETSTSPAGPSPTISCESENPALDPNEECNMADLPICSGHQVAQCAWFNTPEGVVSRYTLINCPLGSVCSTKTGTGYAVCVRSLC